MLARSEHEAQAGGRVLKKTSLRICSKQKTGIFAQASREVHKVEFPVQLPLGADLSGHGDLEL